MSPDPLRDRIDQELKRQEHLSTAQARRKSESRVERMREDVTLLGRFFLQVSVAATWVWQRLLRPVWRAMRWIFVGLFLQYRRLWALWVYRRDSFGALRLSKTRAGLFLAGTVLAAWCAVGIAGFSWDAGMFALTRKQDEVIYLTNSQEVDAVGNVHSVKGCDALPCSDTDSVYFRINPSAFNHAWSLVHNRAFFFPDYVGAAVPPGLNRCVITSYGVRVKLLMRGFDVYPELLRASCAPVSTDNAPAQPD